MPTAASFLYPQSPAPTGYGTKTLADPSLAAPGMLPGTPQPRTMLNPAVESAQKDLNDYKTVAGTQFMQQNPGKSPLDLQQHLMMDPTYQRLLSAQRDAVQAHVQGLTPEQYQLNKARVQGAVGQNQYLGAATEHVSQMTPGAVAAQEASTQGLRIANETNQALEQPRVAQATAQANLTNTQAQSGAYTADQIRQIQTENTQLRAALQRQNAQESTDAYRQGVLQNRQTGLQQGERRLQDTEKRNRGGIYGDVAQPSPTARPDVPTATQPQTTSQGESPNVNTNVAHAPSNSQIPAGNGQKLNAADANHQQIARAILDAAGGDVVKAQRIADQYGWKY